MLTVYSSTITRPGYPSVGALLLVNGDCVPVGKVSPRLESEALRTVLGLPPPVRA